MSRQHAPAATPLPTDVARAAKSRRDKDAVPTLADFPVGRHLLCDYKYPNGFMLQMECVVAEAYQSKEFASRWDDGHLVMIVRVAHVDHERGQHLLGHLAVLSLQKEGYWWQRGPRWSRRPLESFEGTWYL